ncbi:hypothetical protein D3C72_1807610 [compost metagenome]
MLPAEPVQAQQHHQAQAQQPADQRRFQRRVLPHPEHPDKQQQRHQRLGQAQGVEGANAAGGVVQGQQAAFEHRQRHRQQQQPGQQAELGGHFKFVAERPGQGHADQGQGAGHQAAVDQHLAQ